MINAEQIARDEALERAFDRKRANFLEDYDLTAKPALIWQAWPTAEIKLDLSSEKLHEAICGGGGPGANDGWWHGFKPYGRPSLVFNGLTSTRDYGSTGWATETHVDGHIAAGVWTFPESANGSNNPQLGVTDFYVDAFHDFTYLACKFFEVAGVSGTVHLTATMHQADKLAFLVPPGRVVVSAPKRKSLRWPIWTMNTAEMPETGLEMATQFMRAYGRSTPKP